MKYYYELDEYGRICSLSEDKMFEGTLPTIELETDVNFKLSYYGIKNGKIFEIGLTEEEKQTIENNTKPIRIQLLKKLLEESDWKVVVNAELIQAGLPPKYPNLHEERQAWRDEINALER